MSKIEKILDADKGLAEGLAVLSRDEWLDLSAFTDNSIYFFPSHEKMLRAAINLQDTEKLPPEFEVTIQKYARLKGYCETFDKEILPGTRKLATSVISYAINIPDVCDALTAAITASQGPAVNITLESALAELSRQWQSLHPSPSAQVARKDFVKYIRILKDDAELMAGRATDLHTKLVKFHSDLKSSNAEFVADAMNYQKLFGRLSPEVLRMKQELDGLQKELDGMRKQESDLVIVLETAPLYILLIPWFGPFILAGVLTGAGTALGAVRQKIWAKLQEAIAINDKLGPKEKFLAQYQYGQESTDKTANEAKAAAKLVEKIKNAWSDITDNLTDLDTRLLGSANQNSLAGEWDVAKLRLATSRTSWSILKTQAEKYLMYQLDRADNLDDAMKGVVVQKVA
jgi:hypothetical protein